MSVGEQHRVAMKMGEGKIVFSNVPVLDGPIAMIAQRWFGRYGIPPPAGLQMYNASFWHVESRRCRPSA